MQQLGGPAALAVALKREGSNVPLDTVEHGIPLLMTERAVDAGGGLAKASQRRLQRLLVWRCERRGGESGVEAETVHVMEHGLLAIVVVAPAKHVKMRTSRHCRMHGARTGRLLTDECCGGLWGQGDAHKAARRERTRAHLAHRVRRCHSPPRAIQACWRQAPRGRLGGCRSAGAGAAVSTVALAANSQL